MRNAHVNNLVRSPFRANYELSLNPYITSSIAAFRSTTIGQDGAKVAIRCQVRLIGVRNREFQYGRSALLGLTWIKCQYATKILLLESKI
jgi:hypothetical protein